MTPTRRKFLRTGATVALVASIPTKLIFGQGARGRELIFQDVLEIPSPHTTVAYLRRSSFIPYVNSVFEVRVQRGGFTRSVPITLVSVGDSTLERRSLRLKKASSAAVRDEDTFTLLFRGSLRTPVNQDVYDIRHSALGTMNLLLVRVMHEDTTTGYYEVIFNRTRP